MKYFLNNNSPHQALRLDNDLNHMHWSTTRRYNHHQVLAFAFDHRSQFKDMADRLGVSHDKISWFKQLALNALRNVANGQSGFGALIDGSLGEAALHDAMAVRLWVARPVELPGSRPIQFEIGPDMASALREWPIDQIVKCLVDYHPEDDDTLKRRQEESVLRMFEACRNTEHELLLEVISSKHGPINSTTISSIMERFYTLGVRPDWWKLEPSQDPVNWTNIESAIEGNDSFCRGIVLLGLEAPLDQLINAFRIAAKYNRVKGFAIGRSIFGDVAESWPQNQISDEGAIAKMSKRFQTLVTAWKELRS